MPGEDTAKPFDSWAIVEVMGHQCYAGRVTEETIAGTAFVRVDVPAIDGTPAFTKLLGASAIFCITPCDEEIARSYGARCGTKPQMAVLRLPKPTFSGNPCDRKEYDDEEDYI